MLNALQVIPTGRLCRQVQGKHVAGQRGKACRCANLCGGSSRPHQLLEVEQRTQHHHLAAQQAALHQAAQERFVLFHNLQATEAG